MKKTLIALLALSGMAFADATANLGAATGTWVSYSNASWTTGANSASVNGGWGGATALIQLDEAISLAQDETLKFSYTYNYNAGDQNAIYSITLRGEGGATAIAFGNTAYGATDVAVYAAPLTSSGFADCTAGGDTLLAPGTAQALRTDAGNSGDRFQVVTPEAENIITTTLPASYTVDSEIAYNTDLSQFVLTMTVGEDTVSLNLGNSVAFDTIVFATDGNTSQSFSNLSITTPEPATATLSLLALAGLAARRKRH